MSAVAAAICLTTADKIVGRGGHDRADGGAGHDACDAEKTVSC